MDIGRRSAAGSGVELWGASAESIAALLNRGLQHAVIVTTARRNFRLDTQPEMRAAPRVLYQKRLTSQDARVEFHEA